MQSFSVMTMHAKDFTSNEICSKLNIKFKVSYIWLIKHFKTKFSKDLAAMLPNIRGQGAEETELAELISSVHACPFDSNDMDKNLKGKKRR